MLDLCGANESLITVLKLGGILSCVFYVKLYAPKDIWLALALLVTLAADIILALDNTSMWGVLCFCLTQMLHTARLEKIPAQTTPYYLMAIAIIVAMGLIMELNLTVVFAGAYAFLLINNVGISLKQHNLKRSLMARFGAAGFCLFLLCDICVAGSFLAGSGIIPIALKRILDFLAWVFYFPSQIFIANSSENMIKLKQYEGR